jgi:hypothetical protein
MNVEIETEAAQFLFRDYINSNFFAVYSTVDSVALSEYQTRTLDLVFISWGVG